MMWICSNGGKNKKTPKEKQMSVYKTTKHKWINYIDSSLLDIYPIQFANCDRLRNNDAVYIFDEVGSGKTINGGLMALDYLYENTDKNVLIVTTNALAKKGHASDYGQFLNDWYEKLPFRQLGMTGRIDIVNNHYINLSKKSEYGLIIVDEAHLFLSTDSLRHLCLKKLRADKVVFLTATPIKTSKDDLHVYVDLARSITQKVIPDNWIDEIGTCNKVPKDIICSTFDTKCPVSRYFKDTIRAINVEGYQKTKAKRRIPQLWEYEANGISKKDVLLKEIDERLRENRDNRFVVFTRLVEKEAMDIGAFLQQNGFVQYKGNHDINENTYKIITGENAYELSNYKGTSNLPSVLILTYQIAEQGVNLPGFNHVVNYHISAFPSALEQRFGRIDRMGQSESEEINMCFLVSKNVWDTNTWNFYCATSIYLRNLISYLPSKNTMLSEKIIRKYSEMTKHMEAYIAQIRELINDDKQLKHIIDYFKELKDLQDKKPGEIVPSNAECRCDRLLFEFIEENAIEIQLDTDLKTAKNNFIKEVESALGEYESIFKANEDISADKCLKIIETAGDKVFYLNNEGEIETIDAIKDCAEQHISKQENFVKYTDVFKKEIRLPIIIHDYLEEWNRFFEMKFEENAFYALFPYDGYRDLFEAFLTNKEITKDDRQLILDHCDAVVSVLPVFKMFDAYKTILQNLVNTQKGGIRIKFDFNPFNSAFNILLRKVRRDIEHFGLSDAFFEKYFMNLNWKPSEIYTIEVNEDTNAAQVSNWYKLAYHYTRKEAACFMYRRTLCKNESDNFYWLKDELLKALAANYDSYAAAVEARNNGGSAPKQQEIVEMYAEAERALKPILKKAAEEDKMHQSLFNHYIFTESDHYRAEAMKISVNKSWKVLRNDWWTQGIFYEVAGQKYEECTLDKIAKLPEGVQGYSIY